MNDLGHSFREMLNQVVHAIPNVIQALLLLILAWIVAVVAKNIIEKLLVKLGAHKAMSRTKLIKDEAKAKSFLESIAKFVYLLVFILFLPAILDALNMDSVSGPISNMMNKLLGFIPNIIAAAVILIIGYVIAKLIRELSERFLVTVNVDRWFNKVKPASSTPHAAPTKLSSILANVLFIVILIPVITMALEALAIESISNPITQVLNNVLQMIPNIFIAIVLIIAGYYIGRIVGHLLSGLLEGTGINQVLETFGVEYARNKLPFNLSKTIGMIVQVLIILFFVVEALHVLQLDVLNMIGGAIITYIPYLVSGLLILGGGMLLANFLEGFIKKYTNSSLSATIIKYVVIVFAVFMTLDQLHFATSIVNIAFILILGGLMVAFAIAFGIGGRDFARSQLAKAEKQMRKDQHNPTIDKPEDFQ
ncbi:Conserved TM helix [Gracilibacillus ureilyticus]|uniref:Conserved TM helix n=1 Tax=Gracilibacillus ureilyticus TaxID=531814 RepID=A0A1H9M7N0_9BACI|nr:mechanosensitive ion channel [Gracilibacillus ureilyticus]SER19750.1 Conserved TM helix [Gracilibacillus ureilyticus]